AQALLHWLKKFRYLHFGIVGASGTVVNLLVLFVGHEYLFSAIEPAGSKPYASLALAIALATINNFTWNRLWTWSDRLQHYAQLPAGAIAAAAPRRAKWKQLLQEFAKYATASGFGSALQYALTLLLTGSMDYRLANICAIVIASVSNFLANDRWTFKRR
ncbi:MAG: GtrA family protein, partial [Rhodoferax sp.]|nr:GtrA family protein [Rhodoferax sp.]